MVFPIRSPLVRVMAVLFATMLMASSAAQQERPHGMLQALDNKDLTDLLDADVDEPFQQQGLRHLQDAGTDAPTSAPTPSPADGGEDGEDGERGFETFSPTPSASSTRDLFTEAPVTSGASSWRSAASVASAVVVAGSVAAAAVMA